MGSKTVFRPKMSREERAKQFMPFAALKGYEEALKEKEKIVVPRRELSEETKEQLDRRIDTDARVLKIVNTKIAFEDLFQIQGDQFERSIE